MRINLEVFPVFSIQLLAIFKTVNYCLSLITFFLSLKTTEKTFYTANIKRITTFKGTGTVLKKECENMMEQIR